MCGIFGIMGNKVSKEFKLNVLRNLAIANKARGTDATGLATITADGGTRVVKEPMQAPDFVKTEAFFDFLDSHEGNPIIGHTRNGTGGSPKENKNNHPLVSERTGIAVTHNGSVRDPVWRATGEDGTNPFMLDPFTAEVDSEAILRLIDTLLYIPREDDGSILPQTVADTPKDQWNYRRVSTETAIIDAVFNLNGNNTCALIDPAEPESVYIWTAGNPCSILYIPQEKAIIWSSLKVHAVDSLKIRKTNWFMNFFSTTYEEPTPEYMVEEVPKELLVKISPTDNEDEPFDFKLYDLSPGGADNLRKSLGDKIKVTNKTSNSSL